MAAPTGGSDATNKTYVDNQVTGAVGNVALNTAGDTGTGSVNLKTESLAVKGTANQIESVAAAQGITLKLSDKVTASLGKADNAVQYDSTTKDKVTLGTTGTPVQLTNVKAGDISSAASTDAVNGGQLFATNQNVATNTTNITKNTGDITAINSQLDAGAFTVSANISANNGTKDRIAKDENINFANGTNTTATYDAGTNTFKYSVVDAPTFAGTVAAPTFVAGKTTISDGKVTGLAAPTGGSDATNKTYVDNQVTGAVGNVALNTAGDTGTGSVNLKTESLAVKGTADQIESVAAAQGITLKLSDKVTASLGKADNAVQYDTPTKNKVTLGTAGTPVQLTNVKAGDISSAASTDAVNGGQLFATNQNVATNTTNITKNTGDITAINSQLDAGAFTVTANNGTKDRIAKDENINFANGTNTTATYDAGTNTFKYSVVDAPTFAGTVAAPTFVAGKTTISDGKVTGLAAPTGGSDATNKTYVDNQVTGAVGNVALNTAGDTGTGSVNLKTESLAVKGTADQIESVAAAQGITLKLSDKVTASLGKADNAVQYDTPTKNKVTLGTAGTPVQLTNVKAGDISSAASTDAVNGGQLFATNQNVATNTTNITKNTGDITAINSQLDAGAFTVTANNGTKDRIAKDENINFANGTNTTATYDAGTNTFKYSVVDAPTFAGTVAAPTFVAGKTTISDGKVTGLAAPTGGSDATNKTYVDNQVTGAVGNVALNTAGDTGTGSVNLKTESLAVKGTANQIESVAAAQGITLKLSDKVTASLGKADNAVQYDSTTKDKVTLGTAGTPVQLTNVKAGDISSATSTDAVNGGQLFATNQNVATNTTNITKNTGDITAINSQLDAGAFTVSANISANNGTKDRIAKDENINFANGTNTTATYDAGTNTFKYSVVDAPTFAGTVAAPTFVAGKTTISDGKVTGLAAPTGGSDATNKTYVDNQVTGAVGNVALNTAGDTGTGSVNLKTESLAVKGTANQIESVAAAQGITLKLSDKVTASLGKADNAVQYDSTTKDKVTLGTTGTPVQLTNVKAGDISSAASTDAVNGGQLFATNQNVATNTTNITKNTGDITAINSQLDAGAFTVSANISANNGTTDRIAKDENINFANGTNTTATYDAGTNTFKYSVVDAPTFAGTVAAPTFVAGKTTISDGKVTGLAAPTGGSDATNKTYVDNQVTGAVGNVALNTAGDTGTGSVNLKTESLAVKGTADQIESVAAAQGITLKLSDKVTASLGKADNAVQYDTPTKNKVTLGTAGTPVQLTNVKAGDISSAASTDAVNGGQLFATNQNVATNTTNITKNTGDITAINSQLDAGAFTVTANNGTKDRIAKDENINFANGTNTTATYDAGTNTFKYSVVDAPTFAGTVAAPTFVAGRPP
ncbi:beta strand repeat-containing protein [Paralysiella testudinis]|uniref:Trimeric autotransporter adhesin YadA-like stalk domain-containing protein n=1 Tax=Paralysiella testudinis TaxID=2809020 RepID=A0A892ZGR3_9NEIS|nr:ubiquitin-like domain-containing protein [Paralysiella testudinis]QRQ82311.1 hypothetical protein JQU52_02535 [Paralysiella testudinis]